MDGGMLCDSRRDSQKSTTRQEPTCRSQEYCQAILHSYSKLQLPSEIATMALESGSGQQSMIDDTPHSATGATRASLLVRLRDRADNEAWQTFLEVYAPLLYTFARSRGLQDADASDIAQETLSEVARCIRTFEYQPEKGRFRDWLGLIARRRLGKFFARNAGRPEPLADEPPDETDPEWTAAFHARLLDAAMERIRGDFEVTTWQAFTENWLNDRPVPEVAAATGLSVAAVYVAKSRVLKRLREMVLELAEDIPQLV